eukprot:3197180-Pyramimonas_sp.AAC.2
MTNSYAAHLRVMEGLGALVRAEDGVGKGAKLHPPHQQLGGARAGRGGCVAADVRVDQRQPAHPRLCRCSRRCPSGPATARSSPPAPVSRVAPQSVRPGTDTVESV